MSDVDEHPLTILCVDDERIILTSLKEQLRNALGDVSIETAESGEEGLEVIQDLQETGAPLPLVISDQLMPGMRGEEFLEAVHVLAPDTLKVLLTGQATAEAVGAAVNRAGLYRYIGKPWSEGDLVLTVREAVRAWVGERDLRRKDSELRETHAASLRFVPQEFLALLERERLADVALGDATQRSMMVVFADIMGYSRLTSELGARKAFDVLNEFVRTLDTVFRETGGFISGLEGDGVLALFPGSAEDAVSAGVEAHHALRRLTDERVLGMGLAVHAGDLVLGAVGSADRLKCDVVGDAVNFCARLEGLTRELDVAMLVSGDVAERLGDRFTLRRLPCARLKGRNGNVVVAEVLDALPSGIAGARRETLPSFENAVDSWAQGDMALAEQHLTTVLAEDPDDGLVQYFIRRIREET